MVEVIGKDERVRKQTTCSSCGSVLAYWPYEVQQKSVTDYGGGREIVRFIHCPCGKELTVR